MDNLKMVLHDGTELTITQFSYPMHAVCLCASKEAALVQWAMLTPDNLASVTVTQKGEALAAYQYAELDGVQFVMNSDDTVTAHFYMKGERLPHPDAEYVTAAKILMGEEE